MPQLLSGVVVFTNVLFVSAWLPSFTPPYCNDDFTSRKIPPLTNQQQSYVTSLEQVQVLIRHGSRTPYTNYNCWANYKETVFWNNCNVTELMLASPSYTNPNLPAEWLFRKLYDGSPNLLGGNCLTGQLLLEGYEQEQANGQWLYDAYLNQTELPLFDTNIWTDINTDEEIYLRSDDETRTLMSGQILMHSFFNITEEIIVPWHTGDYSLDQIYPNSEVCPLLDTLESEIYSTIEWLTYNQSQFVSQLQYQLDGILGHGYWSFDYIFDCMMTAVCTKQPIPEGNYGNSGIFMNETIFNNTIYNSMYAEAFLNLYNNSQWSKLAMGNTVWHVKSNIENILYNTTSSTGSTTPLRMALYSGHDTTIIPFLAAILKENWDGKWAGYASLVTIELYKASAAYKQLNPSNSNYVFRMVYNSKPMLVPGCTDTLCDISILLNTLAFGQQYMPCSVPDVTTDDHHDNVNSNDDCLDKSNMSQTDWIIVVFISSLLGFLVGASMVVFYEKRRLESQRSLLSDHQRGANNL